MVMHLITGQKGADIDETLKPEESPSHDNGATPNPSYIPEWRLTLELASLRGFEEGRK